jgi:peroxiredoxin
MERRPTRLPYAVAALAALLVLLAAWAGRDRFAPLGPGSVAPHFVALGPDGQESRLDERGEKVVLVNIWATWCPPCLKEMPSMQRLWEALEHEDFEILAVSVDARLGEVDSAGRPGGNVWAFADSLGLTFTILHDPSGGIQRTYQTTGVPESFLIGRDGTIYKKVIGAMEWDAGENRELIERLLDG